MEKQRRSVQRQAHHIVLLPRLIRRSARNERTSIRGHRIRSRGDKLIGDVFSMVTRTSGGEVASLRRNGGQIGLEKQRIRMVVEGRA